MGAEWAVSLSAAFANCSNPFNPSTHTTRIKRFVLPKLFCIQGQKRALQSQSTQNQLKLSILVFWGTLWHCQFTCIVLMKSKIWNSMCLLILIVNLKTYLRQHLQNINIFKTSLSLRMLLFFCFISFEFFFFHFLRTLDDKLNIDPFLLNQCLKFPARGLQ